MLPEIDLISVDVVDDPRASTDPCDDETLVGQKPVGALDSVEVDVEGVREGEPATELATTRGCGG